MSLDCALIRDGMPAGVERSDPSRLCASPAPRLPGVAGECPRGDARANRGRACGGSRSRGCRRWPRRASGIGAWQSASRPKWREACAGPAGHTARWPSHNAFQRLRSGVIEARESSSRLNVAYRATCRPDRPHLQPAGQCTDYRRGRDPGLLLLHRQCPPEERKRIDMALNVLRLIVFTCTRPLGGHDGAPPRPCSQPHASSLGQRAAGYLGRLLRRHLASIRPSVPGRYRVPARRTRRRASQEAFRAASVSALPRQVASARASFLRAFAARLPSARRTCSNPGRQAGLPQHDGRLRLRQVPSREDLRRGVSTGARRPPRHTPHDLRHTWASLHMARGMPLPWIREQCGWTMAKLASRRSRVDLPTRSRRWTAPRRSRALVRLGGA